MEITLNVNLNLTASKPLEELLNRLLEGTAVNEPTSEPAGEKKPEPEKKAKPEPEKAPEPAEPTMISDEEMRGLMDMTIAKFAGNGWKDAKDPKSLSIRKGCTSAFKQIAKYYGAEKPTLLDREGREKFCKELDNIYIETKEGSMAADILWQPF